jgi:two-component system nitrate/nitrite response regulator NarL
MASPMPRRSETFLKAHDATSVPTVVLCDNSILRLGLEHLLANTCFHVLAAGLDRSAPLGSSLPETVSERVALILVATGPDGNEAPEIVEQLRGRSITAKIVVLTDHADVKAVMRAYRAGADGLLVSTTRHDALIKSLELIMMGERLFPATVLLEGNPRSEHHEGDLQRESAPPILRSLSERELEVLSRLTKGAQDKVIARDLNLAEATVKVHVKSLLKKLGAQNRTQAAVLASSYLP